MENPQNETLSKLYEELKLQAAEVVNGLEHSDLSDFIEAVSNEEFKMNFLQDYKVAVESAAHEAISRIPHPASAGTVTGASRPVAKKIAPRRQTHTHSFNKAASQPIAENIAEKGATESTDSTSEAIEARPRAFAKKIAPRRPTRTHAFNGTIVPSASASNDSLPAEIEDIDEDNADDCVSNDANEDIEGEQDEDDDDNGDSNNNDILLSRLESMESQLTMSLLEVERLTKERVALLARIAELETMEILVE